METQQQELQLEAEPGALAPGDPRRRRMDEQLARLERRVADAERSTWVGPHKADVGVDAHKALGLDEGERLAHAQRFAATTAAREQLAAATDHQLKQEQRARRAAAMETKEAVIRG